jgi:hypothetical protein
MPAWARLDSGADRVSLTEVPEPYQNRKDDQEHPEAALEKSIVDVANKLRGRKPERRAAGDHQQAVANTQKPLSHVDRECNAGASKSHHHRRSLGVMLRKAEARGQQRNRDQRTADREQSAGEANDRTETDEEGHLRVAHSYTG